MCGERGGAQGPRALSLGRRPVATLATGPPPPDRRPSFPPAQAAMKTLPTMRAAHVGAVAVDDAGRGLRPRKGQELAGHNPVEVPVLHGFIVVVFSSVESRVRRRPVVQETGIACACDAGHDVGDRQVEGRWAGRRVTKRGERLQGGQGRVGSHPGRPCGQHQVHAEQHGRVGVCVRRRAGHQQQLAPVGRALLEVADGRG